MKYSFTISLFFFIFLATSVLGQYGEKTTALEWHADKHNRPVLFDGGLASEKSPFLLKYSKSFELSHGHNDLLAFLEVINETLVTDKTAKFLSRFNLSNDYSFNYGVALQKGNPIGYADVLPFRKDKEGNYYKLNKFKIRYIGQQKSVSQRGISSQYASQSVLAGGNWFKIALDSTGIYKLDYNDLSQMGFSLSDVASSSIHIHGRPGGMLPESVDDFRYDDLPEMAIKVVDGGDGSFDSGDYILFYGESPDEWHFNESSELFRHTKHPYDNKSYYFVNIGPAEGKRVTQSDGVSQQANTIITTFDEHLYHEKDLNNLLNSGRRWAGEKFDLETSREFNFDLTNRVTSEPVLFRGRFIARSTETSTFTIGAGSDFNTVSVPAISLGYNNKYAEEELKSFSFMSPGESLQMNITYNKANSSSIGWLDYIELNFRKKLVLTDGQLHFRDRQSVNAGGIGRFDLSHNSKAPEIWDVSNPVNPVRMPLENSGNSVSFKSSLDTLKSYVAFDGTAFLEPDLIESVPNQNLHGIAEDVNYIILTRPFMHDEAERLANFHRSTSDLSVRVININKIYNEFSAGTQDITAIRDFFKMLYDRSTDEGFQYALMFGDGSFDYKDLIEDNTNIIPTYQSRNSLHPVSSYATDDYFGYLDEGEGLLTGDRLDIGLGRLPISTPEQAKAAVDKIINYGSDSADVMGDWRNLLTFIGDDEDNNSHTQQANQLANMIESGYPEYNIQKIFFDSYQQEATPGGQRYPGVNEAINTRVEKGALIVNYTGHGGEVGWAHERVLGIPDIENWNNKNKLPVFVTATCEFTRFDDPERTSAGELVFLKENGGGIALFTTTRATYGNPNFALNQSFYSHAFERKNGEYHRMGDLLRLSKALHNSGNNGRKFILIGDPALQMAYPEEKAVLTHVNGQSVEQQPDTLKALSQVTMRGEIRDFQGEVLTDFNGVIFPSVYDKEVTVTTLANDPDSYPMDFEVQKNILYKGKADIKNGVFEYTFIVPKDIDYNMGHGKISLYAAGDNNTDANGYFGDIMVGGFNENAASDTNGPEIEMFINDTTFREGGITDPNPVLYANISDENGINTVGNGIGHDIIAYVNNREDVKVLNDYYVSDLNRYNKGTVTYPFFNLPEGKHTLYMKAWDVHNNSTEASLDFEVIAKDQFKIQRLINYPNPVVDYTSFVFEHNQKNKALEVEIKIFNTSGRLVKTINKSIFADGYKISPIRWNGESSYGSDLRKGIYIYKVMVRSSEGPIAEQSNKLLLIR